MKDCDMCPIKTSKLIKMNTSGGIIRVCPKCAKTIDKSPQRKILSKNFNIY